MVIVKSQDTNAVTDAQMNGRAFFANGKKNLKVVGDPSGTGVTSGPLGIISPAGAPCAVQKRLRGELSPNVDYRYAYTYYNSREGLESNPSLNSNEVTINSQYEGVTYNDNTLVGGKIVLDIEAGELAAGVYNGFVIFLYVEVNSGEGKKWYSRIVESSTYNPATLTNTLTITPNPLVTDVLLPAGNIPTDTEYYNYSKDNFFVYLNVF